MHVNMPEKISKYVLKSIKKNSNFFSVFIEMFETCIYIININLLFKTSKYAKICKIKFNIFDSMSYETNL